MDAICGSDFSRSLKLCAVPDLWNQVRMRACFAAGGTILGAWRGCQQVGFTWHGDVSVGDEPLREMWQIAVMRCDVSMECGVGR